MGIKVKTKSEIDVMAEGGKKLAKVKKEVEKAVAEGENAFDLDKLAENLVLKEGGKPSFKMVSGYHWTTCVNLNEGVVHGIPKKTVVFKKGDVVSVDLGMFYKGFHTDTSFTVGVEPRKDTEKMLWIGKEALKTAISRARVGNKIFDISEAIEAGVKKGGYSPIRALVGHGVGRDLHEEPQIPCFAAGTREKSLVIPEGAVFAIEVMYAKGSGDVVIEDDGWTISTHDGKISALFEETVAITKNGPIVLTD
jgi:methionyl aminopeptidase